MSAAQVKELRERTGLGLLECKKALAAADGDIEKAIEELRKSSGMKAAKKAGRTAADGVVTARIADDGSYGVLVEVNSETDFVARDDNFLGFVDAVVGAASVRRVQLMTADTGVVGAYVHGNNRIAVLVALKQGDQDLARDVAMHVAAVNPQVVSPDDMPAEVIEKEKEIFTAQAQDSGKPAEIIDKMIGGRIKKFLAENSLLEQAFVKDPEVTVGKLVARSGAQVSAFCRFEVGEGITVEKVDFASEVAAQLNG